MLWPKAAGREGQLLADSGHSTTPEANQPESKTLRAQGVGQSGGHLKTAFHDHDSSGLQLKQSRPQAGFTPNPVST
jgi:hypothetical protein